MGSFYGEGPVECIDKGMRRSSQEHCLFPQILLLSPTLGFSFSVQWLAVSSYICIGQALAELLRRQVYQAPVTNHFVGSAIVTGFGDCRWDGSLGGVLSEWPILQFLLYFSFLHFL